MEMKGNIFGDCLVYMQNGSYTKYGFVSQWVTLTPEWQRFVFSNITPSGPTGAWQANTPGDNRAMLATYTIYGTGRNPTVRNVQIEAGPYVSPFTAETNIREQHTFHQLIEKICLRNKATLAGFVELMGMNYRNN